MVNSKICVAGAMVLALVLSVSSLVYADSECVKGQATVTRDEKGVWFVEACSLYDAFEAMGYAVAQDRLWQAEVFRRTGKGKLSEILGSSLTSTDIFVRTIGYSEEELRAGFESLKKKYRTIVQAYVDGFNRRIAEVHQDASLLPFEFKILGFMPEDWTVTDVLAWGIFLGRKFDPEALKTGQLDNATLLQELAVKFPNEYFQMFSDLRWINDPDAITMIPEEEEDGKGRKLSHGKNLNDLEDEHEFSSEIGEDAKRVGNRIKNAIKKIKEINAGAELGSYAWVVSGEKTASGNPILYSGPQMEFGAPSIALEGSIKAPGYQVSGMIIPGIPGILIGRTPHHTWSIQVGHAHTTDYFLEDSASVWLNRYETIKIAGGGEIILPVYHTHHGPVIHPIPYDPSNPPSTIISWKYAHRGEYEFDLVEALFQAVEARNVRQFEKKFIEKIPISVHICYADRQGNIAYWMSGRDPIRPEGVDTRLPQLGDGSQEWPEPVTLKPRAHAMNPQQGFFGGWNSKASKDYNNNNRLERNYFGPFHRSHAIVDYLSSHDNLSFEEVRDLALNIATTDSFGEGGNPWKFVAEDFSRAVDAYPTLERLEALELLQEWDGHFVAGGESQWISGILRADAWVLQDKWIEEVLRLTCEDELLTATLTWQDQPTAILFDVLLHALAGESSGIVNSYDWFQDTSNSGKPTTAEEITVLALDNVLATLGERPWDVERGTIAHKHDLLGLQTTTPYFSRATYDQCVEVGRHGPVRIESMFAIGESGTILGDPLTGPEFDQNFFSMKGIFDSFAYRNFPLFKTWEDDDEEDDY